MAVFLKVDDDDDDDEEEEDEEFLEGETESSCHMP
jgi:hypothetical protein